MIYWTPLSLFINSHVLRTVSFLSRNRRVGFPRLRVLWACTPKSMCHDLLTSHTHVHHVYVTEGQHWVISPSVWSSRPHERMQKIEVYFNICVTFTATYQRYSCVMFKSWPSYYFLHHVLFGKFHIRMQYLNSVFWFFTLKSFLENLVNFKEIVYRLAINLGDWRKSVHWSPRLFIEREKIVGLPKFQRSNEDGCPYPYHANKDLIYNRKDWRPFKG